MPASQWRIDGHAVQVSVAGLKAQLDLRRPDLGLQLAGWRNQPLRGITVLGVAMPGIEHAASDFDSYVRGADLVVTFPETAARPYRVQAYWRVVENEQALESWAIDLELSVQTPLLDCTPAVHTRTQLEGIDSLARVDLTLPRSGQAQALVDATDSVKGEVFFATLVTTAPRLQYVEMIHARDSHSNRIESSQAGWRLEHDVFEPGLEKGVIRRVRVRGLFCVGEADDARLSAAYHSFHDAPLPLTT